MKLYQTLAELYDLLYSYKDYDLEAKLLLEQLCDLRSPRILDVACGTGAHLQAIRNNSPDAELTGIDLNPQMLAVAKKKRLNTRLLKKDMRTFELPFIFDLVYCLSSSIQYALTAEDLKSTIETMRTHAPNGTVIFDLAYCEERWKEGYTNITANSNKRYEVAELYTSHSKQGLSYWNPLYLVKDLKTGKLDMQVDKQTIRIWSIKDVEATLKDLKISYYLKNGFEQNEPNGVPVFILEGLKK